MLKLLVASLILVSSSIPTHARARCDELDKAKPDATCVVGVLWDGKPGTWFHYTVVPELQRRLLLFPNLEAQVTNYSLIDSHREQEMASLRSAIERYKQSNSYLQQEVENQGAENRRLRAEIDRGRPWYTSPVFWGIAMFVAGAAIQHACCGPGQ